MGRSGRVVALVFVAVSGCAPGTRSGFLRSELTRAAFDLNCRESKVKVTEVVSGEYSAVMRADGCGKQKTYNYIERVGWVAEAEGASEGAEETPLSQLNLGKRFREKKMPHDEERALRKCVKLDDTYAACYFALYEFYRDEDRPKEASISCQNFLKFGQDASPRQKESCQKYLSTPPLR